MHRGSFPALVLALPGAAGMLSLAHDLCDSVGVGRVPGYAIERKLELTDLDTAVRGTQSPIKRK